MSSSYSSIRRPRLLDRENGRPPLVHVTGMDGQDFDGLDCPMVHPRMYSLDGGWTRSMTGCALEASSSSTPSTSERDMGWAVHAIVVLAIGRRQRRATSVRWLRRSVGCTSSRPWRSPSCTCTPKPPRIVVDCFCTSTSELRLYTGVELNLYSN